MAPSQANLKRLVVLVLLTFVFGCTATSSKPVAWTTNTQDDWYPLDFEERKTGAGPLSCPVVQILEYEGVVARYKPAVKVNPFFRERLQQFEMVVQSVAHRHYQTEDVVVRHWGTHNCRRIGGRNKLSEHAFANAIDISAFEIGGERIQIEKHWWSTDKRARFLHDLVNELATRPDIFRGMLGPGEPRHEDHFHFDAAPYRYIDVHVPR